MTWELTLRTRMRQPERAEDWICWRLSNTWRMSLLTNRSFPSGDSLEVPVTMLCAKTWNTPTEDGLRSPASTFSLCWITWNPTPWPSLSTQRSALSPMSALREPWTAEEEPTELTVVFHHTFPPTATSSSMSLRSLTVLAAPISLQSVLESRRSKPPRRDSPLENEPWRSQLSFDSWLERERSQKSLDSVTKYLRLYSLPQNLGIKSSGSDFFNDQIIANGWLSLNLIELNTPLRRQAIAVLIPTKPANGRGTPTACYLFLSAVQLSRLFTNSKTTRK